MAKTSKKTKGKKNTRVDHMSTQKKKNSKSKNDKFNFDNEIVIGVNVVSKEKEDKPSQKTKKIKKEEKIKNTRKNNNKTQKKDNKKAKNILKIILIICIFAGIIVFIMTTPLFNIKEIEINGNTKVSKDRIESLSQISLNVNTYKYFKRDIVKKIKEEPYIENVIIKRKLPNKIIIDVNERTPSYVVSYAGGYIYIDNKGYILEITNEPIEKIFLEGLNTEGENLLPGNRLNNEDLEKINVITKIIESLTNNNIANKLTTINMSNKNDDILKFEEEGKIVHLGDASNINDRILMLKEILVKESNSTGEIFIQDMSKIYFRQDN